MTSHPANPSALRRRRTWALIGLASFALTACGILTPTPVAPEPEPEGGLLFGPEGVQLDNILGGGGAGGGAAAGGGGGGDAAAAAPEPEEEEEEEAMDFDLFD